MGTLVTNLKVKLQRDVMKTNSECCAGGPKAAAVALGRWVLGIIFLFAGIGKFAGGYQNFIDGMTKQFEKTWLPSWLLAPFNHVLPFAEVLLGVLLILGIARNVTLFATGLLLLTLTFGQILLGQPPVVFYNFIYTTVAAALLFLHEHDRWTLIPWCGNKEASSMNPPTK
jgi:thiosulfate dehydrogenase [quinone] large subunit